MLILKVLNGPLFGAELALPDEDCFMRVVSTDAQAVNPDVESTLNASANMPVLSIPFPDSTPNFIIRPLADADVSGTIRIVVFHNGQVPEQLDLALNSPVSVGRLRFAVRAVSDTWSVNVLSDREQEILTESAPSAPPAQRSRLRSIVGAVVGVFAIATAAVLFWPASVPAQGASQRVVGLPGITVGDGEKLSYVIVPNADIAAVARRKLQRAGRAATTRVLTEAEAAKQLGQALDDAGIRYFSVRMTDPRRPVLLLPAQLPEDCLPRLRRAVPYVEDFTVLVRTQRDAQDAARRLVGDLGVKADFASAPDRFVVSINDYLSDTRLDALGRALKSFHAQWGDRYVQFVVNQYDLVNIDGVKTGGFGYELRGTRHLYFQG